MAANAERLIELFHAANTRPAGVERDAFLRDACQGDAGMEAQIRSLLAAHEEVGDFLQVRPPDPAASLPTEKPGDWIGRYKLLEPIGEGGCGVVYLAEQTEPVRRRVALKVIKLGMDTKAVVARFEAERQALALMDHPNIARVLDAGTTDEGKAEGPSSRSDGRRPVGEPPPSDLGLGTSAPGPRTSPFALRPSPFGRPYFVMELVRGIRITEYCDQNGLSTRERLELFIQVCQAVQHAHQKGIIHRDLKPSNILVASHDGVPVPKVIDFGIAKAVTNQRLTDQTVFTAFEQFLGTPAYMSPEQAEMSGLDVDTRSDIYSLGVLLYELLTGVTPLDARELKRAGLDEMRRLIREKDPVPPSTRLTQEWARRGWGSAPAAAVLPDKSIRSWFEAGAVPGVETQGQSRLREQIKLVRGDLDWIVMKCLEKDRTRRYETANGLAADLQRHLNDEPVVARPPSAAYRFEKAWRRHKVAFTAAGAVAVSLLLGLGGSWWQAGQAARAERKAIEAREEAVVAASKEQAQRYVAEEERLNAERARADAERQLYAAKMHEARLAFEENNFARLREILTQTADDPNRGFEWYYWQRQAHLESKTLRGHLAPVVAAAYSPDGRRIVTGSFDHTARIWDADEGTELLVLRGHRREVRAVAFSPDGSRIVTGSADRTARVWEAANGRVAFRLEGHTNWVTSVAFSPDGRRLVTGSADGTVRLWDAASGQQRRVLNLSNWVWTVAFSNDGRWVLTGSGDETARLWDAETGEEREDARIQPPSAHNPALGPIGRQTMPLTAVFSPGGQWVVTGSQNQTVRVWDRETGRERFTLRGKPHWVSPLHSDIPLAVAFPTNAQFLVTGRLDRTADVWSLTDGTNRFTLRGHEAEIAAVAVSPDGRRVVTGSHDHTAKVWDASRSRESLTLVGHSMVIPTAAFSGDGGLIATGSWDGTARVWEAATGRELHILPHGGDRLWAVAFSPDDRLIITGGDDGVVRVWETTTGELMRSNKVSNAEISNNALAFLPDGRRIVVGRNDRKAAIHDATTGEVQREFEETEPIVQASVAPDGRWIVTVSESTFVDSGGFRALSPGGDGIVNTAFRGSAHVWDAASGRMLFPLLGQLGGISTVAVSRDGRRIVAGGMGLTVSVWDASTGSEELKLEGHSGRVVKAAFLPDGRRIVTSGFDNATTRVWDAGDGRELLTLHGLMAHAVSPDGRRIVAAGPPPATVLEVASEEEVAAWAREEQAARERIEAERAERLAAAERIREAGIKEWLVLGPIPSTGHDGAAALDQALIPDAALRRPRQGDRVQTGQAERIWRAVRLEDLKLDFARVFGAEPAYNAAYAICYLVTDSPKTGLTLHVGSDDQARILLNGQEVYRHTVGRTWEPGQDRVTGLALRLRVTVLVFQVVNETDDWLGSVSVTDADGQPVPGLRVTLDPDATDAP